MKRNGLTWSFRASGSETFIATPLCRSAPSAAAALVVAEQGGELVEHGAAKLFGVGDRDRPAAVAGEAVTGAEGHQLDVGA